MSSAAQGPNWNPSQPAWAAAVDRMSSAAPLSPPHPGVKHATAQNQRIVLHIEARLELASNARPDLVARRVCHWLQDNFTSLQVGHDMTEFSMYKTQ